MVTKKPEIDFDAWTDEDETAAIEEIAASIEVKHAVRGGMYYAKFPDGEEISLPVRMSMDLMEKVTDLASDDSVEQVKAVFRELGDDKAIASLQKQDMLATLKFANDYFTLVNKVAQATVGEFAG